MSTKPERSPLERLVARKRALLKELRRLSKTKVDPERNTSDTFFALLEYVGDEKVDKLFQQIEMY